MVAAVRSGQPQRAVARQFGVSLATVQLWLQRSQGKPLEQVDWQDRSHAPQQQPHQTPEDMVQRVLAARKQLKQHSALGECGAVAIREHLCAQPDGQSARVPSVATINRILERQGAFDTRQRMRRKPPVSGWYLPEVAKRRADIDQTDHVEGLFLEAGQELFAFNLISLHGGWCATWLDECLRASSVIDHLIGHWRQFGLPAYAQFDNSNVFTGPRQYPDRIGTVIGVCLSLGVVPVFAVPNEFGIQSAVESYNHRWQKSVWRRFHFDTIEQARRASDRYVQAVRRKRGPRQEAAPARRPFPSGWTPPTCLRRDGQIVFLRRTDQEGRVSVLGHTYLTHAYWCHRLVRCEVDLANEQLHVYGLRRQAPEEQPLLNRWPYRLPEPVANKPSKRGDRDQVIQT